MKKLLQGACVLLVGIGFLVITGCDTLGNSADKIYDIGDQYFSEATFERHVLTNIGVNGNQGSGRSYEIEVSGKCKVSLFEYTVNVELYSEDETLLDTIEETETKELDAGTEISIRKEVTYDVYTKTDSIKATWSGKSYENPEEASDTPLNPITSLNLVNDDTAMLVGESFELDYTVTPSDADEQVVISSGDPSVVEIKNNTVTAKSVGNTWVSIKVPSDKSNQVSKEIKIRVIEELDYDNFETLYGNRLERATVSVYCKRYNKNWLGQETNVHTVSGKGIIVKSLAYANYFLTDKSIFDPSSSQYEYEEWYITDYLGKEYSVSGIKYHNSALIGIGTFTSSTSYPVAEIYSSYPYAGDYAISLYGNPLTCRVDKQGYLKMSSSSSRSSNVFYHRAGASTRTRGEAIFNPSGEIIGINMAFSDGQAIAVSAIEIRELYNGIFNPAESGGGPIDIF